MNRDVKSRTSSTQRALAQAAPFAAFGLLLYLGCSPDFDALNRGEETGGAGSGSVGGSAGSGGGGTGGTGGTGGSFAGGGSTPCTDGDCGGSPSIGGGGAVDQGGVGGDTDVGGQGGQGGVVDPRVVYYDFESGVQGWVPVESPVPPDYIDSVETSGEAPYEGAKSLAFVIDGDHTMVPPSSGFYGGFVSGNIPSSTEITFWMTSTMPGITVEVYCQLVANYTYINLSDSAQNPLTVGEWRQLRVTTPPEPVLRLGVKLYSPMAAEAGVIYLDEVKW